METKTKTCSGPVSLVAITFHTRQYESQQLPKTDCILQFSHNLLIQLLLSNRQIQIQIRNLLTPNERENKTVSTRHLPQQFTV